MTTQLLLKIGEIRGRQFVWLESPDGKPQSANISVHQAKVIARNLVAGKPYYVASPVFSMTRVELSIFHINANRILRS